MHLTKLNETLQVFSSGLKRYIQQLYDLSINLLLVYRESVNLIGYVTRRLF